MVDRELLVRLSSNDLQTLATALRIAKACGQERPALLIGAMKCEETGGVLRSYENLIDKIDELLLRIRLELAQRILEE